MSEENTISEDELNSAEENAVSSDAPETAAPEAVPQSDTVESSEPVAETTVESAAEGSETSSEAKTDSGESEVVDEVEEELNEFGFRADEMVEEEEEDEEEDDNVSPIEEFVDEDAVVIDEDAIEKNWYILKVQVNRENSICDTLRRRVKVAGMEHYFGEILVPTEDVREFNKAGKQRIVKRKLYPGYVVVNMAINDDSWFLVRETSGIGDFTGAAGKPAPLSPEEIQRILALAHPEEESEGEEAAIKTSIPFKLGDRVRVKEGSLENHEGEVSEIDERNGKVTVMINIFGRPNPVDLDHWLVEKL